MAHKQTKGRGTRGRVWLSTEGVLMFSFVIKREKKKCIYRRVYEITTYSWNGSFGSIEGSRENLDYMFKWTNDIYLEDKKLSGILMEKNDEDFYSRNQALISIYWNLEGDLNAISLKSITGKFMLNWGETNNNKLKMKGFLFRFYRSGRRIFWGK